MKIMIMVIKIIKGPLKNDVTVKMPNFRPPPPISPLVTFFIIPLPMSPDK